MRRSESDSHGLARESNRAGSASESTATAPGDVIGEGQLSRRALKAVRQRGWSSWSQLEHAAPTEITSLPKIDDLTKQEILMAVEARVEHDSALAAMRRDPRAATGEEWAPKGLRFEDQLSEFRPIDTATLLALRQMGITTWGLLVLTDLKTISEHPGIGPKGVMRIKRALKFRSARIKDCAPVYDSPDFSAEELHVVLRTALHSLGPRRRAVIIGRVTRQPPVPLRELGQSLGVRRQQIQELEEESLERLHQFLARSPDTPMSRVLRQAAHLRADGYTSDAAVQRSAPPGTNPAALRLLIRLAG